MRLLAFRLDKQRGIAVLLAGKQALLVSLPGAPDNFVGETQDRLGAAVVLFEGYDPGAGKLFGKVHDVAEIGAAKGIDTLGVVADDHDVVMGCGQKADDLGLKPVGILEFIHHDEAVGVGEAAANFLVACQQIPEPDQKVVVVEQGLTLLVIHVAFVKAEQLLERVGEMGIVPLDQFRNGPLFIEGHAVNFPHGLLAGETPLFGVQPHLRAQKLDHVLAVRPVHDGEGRGEIDFPSVLAQDRVGEGMEGAARYPGAAVVDQQARPPEHLLGGPAGEGQEQDRARIDADLHQMGHPEDQRARLAGPGAGDDQERPFGRRHRLILGLVQLFLVIDPRRAALRQAARF